MSETITSALFSRPSFLSGIARTLDLGGSFDCHSGIEAGEEADADALFADWAAVERDLQPPWESRHATEPAPPPPASGSTTSLTPGVTAWVSPEGDLIITEHAAGERFTPFGALHIVKRGAGESELVIPLVGPHGKVEALYLNRDPLLFDVDEREAAQASRIIKCFQDANRSIAEGLYGPTAPERRTEIVWACFRLTEAVLALLMGSPLPHGDERAPAAMSFSKESEGQETKATKRPGTESIISTK